ncbi:MAG: response regulator [Patescibacteria group bacterium]
MASSEKTAKKESPSRGKRKILLVEDDTFISGMYIAKLALENFDVLLATDGEMGLEYARKQKPDLILLDLMLPKLDGYGVLKALKKSPALAKIPVILLTNLNQQESIDKARKYQIEDYLIKAHFMPSEVIEKVKVVLRKYRR